MLAFYYLQWSRDVNLHLLYFKLEYWHHYFSFWYLSLNNKTVEQAYCSPLNILIWTFRKKDEHNSRLQSKSHKFHENLTTLHNKQIPFSKRVLGGKRYDHPISITWKITADEIALSISFNFFLRGLYLSNFPQSLNVLNKQWVYLLSIYCHKIDNFAPFIEHMRCHVTHPPTNKIRTTGGDI